MYYYNYWFAVRLNVGWKYSYSKWVECTEWGGNWTWLQKLDHHLRNLLESQRTYVSRFESRCISSLRFPIISSNILHWTISSWVISVADSGGANKSDDNDGERWSSLAAGACTWGELGARSHTARHSVLATSTETRCPLQVSVPRADRCPLPDNCERLYCTTHADYVSRRL